MGRQLYFCTCRPAHCGDNFTFVCADLSIVATTFVCTGLCNEATIYFCMCRLEHCGDNFCMYRPVYWGDNFTFVCADLSIVATTLLLYVQT